MLEQVKARIADLEKQKEQMLANFHAISGAIAENEAWLRQLEKDANSPAQDWGFNSLCQE